MGVSENATNEGGFTVLDFVLIICFGVILFLFLRFMYFYLLKSEFKRKYEIDYFPKKVKIHRNKPQKEGNHYTLGFPCWTYSNADGTRDRRRADNGIRYPGCDLYIDEFHIVINNPRLMIRYVNLLRQHNVKIERNKYEEEKATSVLEAKKRFNRSANLEALSETFKDNPYEFESYCAKLYHLMGIDAQRTPNSNDGGYDIVLHYENGDKGLLECKCYSKSNKIGRPLIQKLVGANQIEEVAVCLQRKNWNFVFLSFTS